MIKVFMGVPSMGTREDGQVSALRHIAETYKNEVELVYPKECVVRLFHDHARNAVVKEFLESGCDVLWFLDSDVIPARDVLDILVKPKFEWKAAGAPYPVFMTPSGHDHPQVVFTVYGVNENGMYAQQVPLQGFGEVAGVATGCIFLKKEVFEGMQEPYFEFKYDEKTRNISEGEDLGFCKKLHAKGIKFYIDFEKVCGHMKKVNLVDVNNYALLYAQQFLLAYQRAIKTELAERELSRSQPKSRLILPR